MNVQAVAEIPISVRRWKAYSSYKDSGIKWLGQLPEHWEVKRVKFLASFHGGGTPSKENLDYWNGDIPWISPKDMKSEIVNDSEDHITEEALATSATQLVQPGSVLIVVRSGILKHSIPVAINMRPVALNQDMKAMVPRSVLSPDYLKYLIVGHQDALLVEWRKAGATVESIEHELLVNSYFPIPSLDEQCLIVDLLDRETVKIDALVAKKERLIELLQEKRAALITRAVTKGLAPNVPMKGSGVEWLGEIPAHWEVRRIKFFTTYVTSGSRGWAEYYSDDGAIFLRIGNLTRTGIDLDLTDVQRVTPPSGAEGERTRVRANDVLISITAYIGSVAVVDDKLDAYVNQHIALTRPVLDRVSPRWIAYCFLSAIGKSQFQQLLYGGTKDGLGLDDVRNLIASLPPVKEQTAIVEFLDKESAKTDSLIAKVREGIEKLKEYRTALISAAVTGKIDVREEISSRMADSPERNGASTE